MHLELGQPEQRETGQREGSEIGTVARFDDLTVPALRTNRGPCIAEPCATRSQGRDHVVSPLPVVGLQGARSLPVTPLGVVGGNALLHGVIRHGVQRLGAIAEVTGDGQASPAGKLAGGGEIGVIGICECLDDLRRSFDDPLEDLRQQVVDGHAPSMDGSCDEVLTICFATVERSGCNVRGRYSLYAFGTARGSRFARDHTANEGGFSAAGCTLRRRREAAGPRSTRSEVRMVTAAREHARAEPFEADTGDVVSQFMIEYLQQNTPEGTLEEVYRVAEESRKARMLGAPTTPGRPTPRRRSLLEAAGVVLGGGPDALREVGRCVFDPFAGPSGWRSFKRWVRPPPCTRHCRVSSRSSGLRSA